MINALINNYKTVFEAEIDKLLPLNDYPYNEVLKAGRYSLLLGGKRIRPIITAEFCRLAGGCVEDSYNFAIALEMIHTYSLIHDDLPAMDNDELRRGLPTNHMVYGEAIAILAGDGLLTTAFEAMSKDMMMCYDSPEKLIKRVNAMHQIAKGSGCSGMVAGQLSDIEAENTKASNEMLEYIHLNKTGALIKAAIRAGLYLGNPTDKMIHDMTIYADNLGLAYQIADDILDVVGTTEELGKKTGSDENNNKNTYTSINGLDAAYNRLKELTDNAVKAIEDYYDNAEFFRELVLELAKRNK